MRSWEAREIRSNGTRHVSDDFGRYPRAGDDGLPKLDAGVDEHPGRRRPIRGRSLVVVDVCQAVLHKLPQDLLPVPVGGLDLASD